MIELCETKKLLEEFGFMPRKLLRQEMEDLIAAKGWQQKDFADACKLSPTTISRTLSGKMVITKEIAEIYARVLDLNVEETVRRALVESRFADMKKAYEGYPTILKLFQAVEDFSCLPMIYEEDS